MSARTGGKRLRWRWPPRNRLHRPGDWRGTPSRWDWRCSSAGLTIAAIEVAMNAKASQMERALGRRLMTRCHAFWSFGTVAGALIGGGLRSSGDPVPDPAADRAADLRGADDRVRTDADRRTSRRPCRTGAARAALARALLMCLVPIGALLIEGAMMEWSAHPSARACRREPVPDRGDLRGLRAVDGADAPRRRPAGRAVRAAAGDRGLGPADGGGDPRLRAVADAVAVDALRRAGRRWAARTSIR